MSGSEKTFSRRDRSIIAGVGLLVFAVVLALAAIWVFGSVSREFGAILLAFSAFDVFVALRLIAGGFTTLLGATMIAFGTIGFFVGIASLPRAVRAWQYAEMETEGSKDWERVDAAEKRRNLRCLPACGVVTVVLVPIGIWVIVRKGRHRLETEFWPDARG